MHSPLRWPGGKGRLTAVILPHVPAHQAYVETCCGGAGLFWAKPREWSAGEVLNDVDGDLVTFYRVLHKRGRRLAAEVDAMPYSRQLFRQMLAARPSSQFARAVRFWYVNRVSFGGRGTTFGPRARERATVLPVRILASLDATVERLRGVSFEAVDVARAIQVYDRPSVLFFVDPPYVGAERMYASPFGLADHSRLAAALRAAKGRWLLTYNDCRLVRSLYRGYPRRRLAGRYHICGTRRAVQLLIANAPLRAMRRVRCRPRSTATTDS